MKVSNEFFSVLRRSLRLPTSATTAAWELWHDCAHAWQVKKGPLAETSPMLNDISAVPTWEKARPTPCSGTKCTQRFGFEVGTRGLPCGMRA